MTDITLFNNAIKFATDKHAGQVRKGTTRPYIIHPFAVSALLRMAGKSDAVVIAGLLHDVLEDTDTSLMEVKDCFGGEVANLVLSVTQPDKTKAFKSIPTKSLASLWLKAADIVCNVNDINADHKEVGDAVFDRFAHGKKTLEHYDRMAEAIMDHLPADDSMVPYLTNTRYVLQRLISN
jgi:(p)ppGpp synthase/HD superfamily hydrolase